ncbi:MAG: ATP-binding cassette domain-containing protein, partial [Acidimicrobiales bacterium]
MVRPSRVIARRLAERSMTSSLELAVGVAETASLARELRAFDALDVARAHLRRRVDATADRLVAAQFASRAIPDLSRDVTIAVMVVGLAVIAGSGNASLAEIGTSVVLLLRGLGQAQTVSSVAHQLAELTTNLARIDGYLARWHASAPPSGTHACPPQPVMALDDVSYRYKARTATRSPLVDTTPGPATPEPARPWALEGVTLRLEPGEQVGVIGRTGAGKSTLAGLLLGVLQPDRGRTLAGGVDLRELRPGEWHTRVAWVPPDPRLLNGTMADNIAFFRPGIHGA